MAESIERKVDELLQEGLTLYGRGLERDAVDRWRRVLDLVPGHSEALDYLASAGQADDPRTTQVRVKRRSELPPKRERKPITLEDEEPSSPLEAPALLGLVKSGRYEEALEMLYEARALRPTDASISRSIQHLKGRLIRRYARRLGCIDSVPALTSQRETTQTLGPEGFQVYRLIDGIASFDDIAVSSPLGRLRTLGILCELLESKRIRLDTVSDEPLPEGSPAPSAFPVGHMASLPSPEPTPSMVPAADDAPSVHEMDLRAPAPPSESIQIDLADDFDALFRDATRAYVVRDYAKARTLFERCATLRPDDRRVRVNLERIPAG